MDNSDDHKLTAKELLQAFNEIQSRGKQEADTYTLGQLTGVVSHDGYTVTIKDEMVDATVGFHNTVNVNTNSKQALNQFIEKITSLNAAAS
ncbi:DUF3081 family protein [Halioxenophilus aromaticivorans]|uniref:DUF3081 domain-containing protein n=1 Tax=Halioxenophilus aromaticivorans TaxID=1306992 RepID=A0AAV3TZB4_9ALTE